MLLAGASCGVEMGDEVVDGGAGVEVSEAVKV